MYSVICEFPMTTGTPDRVQWMYGTRLVVYLVLITFLRNYVSTLSRTIPYQYIKFPKQDCTFNPQIIQSL